jgi:hypothetical protein
MRVLIVFLVASAVTTARPRFYADVSAWVGASTTSDRTGCPMFVGYVLANVPEGS